MEMALISTISSSVDIATLMRAGVQDDDFGNINRPVYQWFTNHLRQFNQIPPHSLLVQQFPDFVVNKIDGSIDYLVKEVKSRSVRRKMKEVMAENARKLDAEDPYAILDKMGAQLSALRPRDSISSSMTDKTAMSRYQQYLVKKEDTSLIGNLRTGFDFFDDRRAYWSPGEFSAFVARPFLGKTYAMVHTCAVNWVSGGRVLFVSPELGIVETERRFDVFNAHLLGSPITLSDVRFGNLDSRANYEKYAQIASQRSDLEIIDSIQGRKVSPSKLSTLAEIFKPTIIAIDGIKFVEDDEKASAGWQVIFNVSRDLKELAIRHNCVVLTVQQVKPQVPGHRVPTIEDVSYGDALVQSLDRCITISFNDESSEVRDLTSQKDRISGEAVTTRQPTVFRPEIGQIGRMHVARA
jgi:hypothetical protein